MRLFPYLVLAIISAFGVEVVAAQSAEPNFPPGSAWGLILPGGFEPVDAPMVGYRHPSGSTIVVQDFPKSPAMPLVRTGPDIEEEVRQKSAARNMRLTNFESLTVSGRRAQILTADRLDGSGSAIMMMIDGEARDGVFYGLIPADAAQSVLILALRSAYLTAVERAAPSLAERLEALPFRLDLRGMHVANFVASSGLHLTEGPGGESGADPDQPSLSIVLIKRDFLHDLAREGEVTVADLRKQHPTIRDIDYRIIETAHGPTMEIDFEHGSDTGRPTRQIIWAFSSGGKLVTMLGTVPFEADGYPERFAAIRDSITPR